MKNVVKPECRHGCRFFQINDTLWMCRHASYGDGSYRLGTVVAAREAIERAGGFDKLEADRDAAEARVREAKEQEQRQRATRLVQSLRYE
jgi:hypothetical protein